MKILLIHQNFPGQFKYLAGALCDRGHALTALTNSTRPADERIVRVPYRIAQGNGKDTHPWLTDTESKIIRGEGVFRAAQDLAQAGYHPDLIIAHPGWGEALFLKRVWPLAKLLAYCEYYYAVPDTDLGFDPEFPIAADMLCKAELKNFVNLMTFTQMDQGLAPTQWQRSTYPRLEQDRITVIHDGINTDAACPNPNAWLALQSARLTKEDEIITFVNRNLEPTRGFHTFMRALPKLLHKRPKARVLIVGGDAVSYGQGTQSGRTWREELLAELSGSLPAERIHFLGKLPYAHYLSVLQISRVHVYLSYPFVLSWSLLEAMACGCAVVASDTAPVAEVIENNRTGILTKFFDRDALVASITTLLDDESLRKKLGQAARAHVIEHYDLKTVCLPRQLALIDRLLQNTR